MYREVTTEQPVAEGVAAIYAYERQVPEVAQTKIDGLKRHYGIDDAAALRFFVIHGVLDIEHSGHEREMLGELAAGQDAEAISSTTQRALDAWWDFLSAVDMPAAEPIGASA
jgi:pyrroloquinoline-quinone synthase